MRPTVSVLLIDGAPSAQKFESETDFLALAYSVGARPWSVERISQFDPRRLIPGAIDVPDVLVLANVPSLTAEQAAVVERLVQRGMGLMIFSGDLVDVDLYNQRLYRDGRGLLPAKLDRTDRNADHGHRRREGSAIAARRRWPSSFPKRWPVFMPGNTRPSSWRSAAGGRERVGSLEQFRKSAGRGAKSVRQGAGAVVHLHGGKEVDRLASRSDVSACGSLGGAGDCPRSGIRAARSRRAR